MATIPKQVKELQNQLPDQIRTGGRKSSFRKAVDDLFTKLDPEHKELYSRKRKSP